MNWPTLLFFNGPKGVGKSTLAKILCEKEIERSQIISYVEPVARVAHTLFFPDTHIGPDFGDQGVKSSPLPFTDGSHTVRDFFIDFGLWLRNKYGPEFLGRLAADTTQALSPYYHHFIFENVRLSGDIEPVVRKMQTSAAIIHVEREGHLWENDQYSYIRLPIPTVQINTTSSTPEESVQEIKRLLS